MSLIADKALVQNEKALTRILENTVNEIDNLYDRLTLSFFSKKLHRSISTPTKKGMSIEENLIEKTLILFFDIFSNRCVVKLWRTFVFFVFTFILLAMVLYHCILS